MRRLLTPAAWLLLLSADVWMALQWRQEGHLAVLVVFVVIVVCG